MPALRGTRLEQFKFAIYLLAPIASVYLFSMPIVHENFMTMVRRRAAQRGAAQVAMGCSVLRL